MNENGPLTEMITAYLQAVDAGQTPDREEILARHPELTAELRRFFATQDRVSAMTEPLRPEAPAIPRQFGSYEILGEIGRGGMGVVYRAHHEELGRVVALKVLTGGLGNRAGNRDRFEQESQTLARLEHPGIVPLYEVGEHEGQAYFTMKLIEGPDLRKRLATLKESLAEGVSILVRVCRAVQFAHAKGIIHRDLKPANILLDGNGEVYVTDFGLANRIDQDLGLTATGALVGTPAYMAPEQITGEPKVGAQTDVWALGVILYEMLTGGLPFRGETPLETVHLIQNGLKVRPRDIDPGVDRALERICLCCLRHHPGDRYSSPAALADDLERWLAHDAVVPPRPSRLRIARRWLRGLNNRRLLATVAVVVLACCAWLVSREAQRLDVDRVEQQAAQGQLEPARTLVEEGPSLLPFGAGTDPKRGKARRRLRLLLDEHLYGGLGSEESSLTWNWSPGGRFVGGGDRIPDQSAPGGWRPSLVRDGWTGKHLSKAVAWNDGWVELHLPKGSKVINRYVEAELRDLGGKGWAFNDDLRREAKQLWEGLPEPAGKKHWFPGGSAVAIPVPGEKRGGNQFLLLPPGPRSRSNPKYLEVRDGLRDNPIDPTDALEIRMELEYAWRESTRQDVDIVGNYVGAWSSDKRFLHFWRPGEDLQPGQPRPNQNSLLQATYDVQHGRWVRLVESGFRMYRPADEKSASSVLPPAPEECLCLGRPRILDFFDEMGVASNAVVLRLSPDGTRLLTIWRGTGATHVWRMPGSEVGK